MLSRPVLDSEATKTTHQPQIQRRQDQAVCDDCDWSFGWNLDPDIVEKYFRKHQIETGHTIYYRVQALTEQTTTYIIEA